MSAEDNQGEADREQEGSSEDERVVPYDQPYEDRMLNYIYDIRWHGSRLWEDDTVNIMDWNANAWSYAAQYDYLMDSWMISQGPGPHPRSAVGTYRSVLWDRTRHGIGMESCSVCNNSSIFNVNGNRISHTHYCTVTTLTLSGYNPFMGNVVCTVCRTSSHSYRQGLRRPVIATDSYLGDTVQSPAWTGWERYHIDIVQIDEANIDELLHALLVTFTHSNKPCDFIIAGGWLKSLVQGVPVSEIILKCTRFAARIRESYRNGTNGSFSRYPSSVTFVPLTPPPAFGFFGDESEMTDEQFRIMSQSSELANQLLHLNRLHAHCGEYLPVDLMVSLEHWGTVGRGSNRRYREEDWEMPEDRYEANYKNIGSNKRQKTEAGSGSGIPPLIPPLMPQDETDTEPVNWATTTGTYIFDRPDFFEERDRRFRPSLELRLRVFRTAFQNYFDRLYNVQRPSQQMQDRDELDRNAAIDFETIHGSYESFRIRRFHTRYNNNNCGCRIHHTVETEIINEERAVPRDPELIAEAQRGLDDDFGPNGQNVPEPAHRPKMQRGFFTHPHGQGEGDTGVSHNPSAGIIRSPNATQQNRLLYGTGLWITQPMLSEHDSNTLLRENQELRDQNRDLAERNEGLQKEVRDAKNKGGVGKRSGTRHVRAAYVPPRMQEQESNDNNAEEIDSEEEEELARTARISRATHAIEESVRSAATSDRNTSYGAFRSLAPRLPVTSMVRAPEGRSLSSRRASVSSTAGTSGRNSRRQSSDTASVTDSNASSRSSSRAGAVPGGASSSTGAAGPNGATRGRNSSVTSSGRGRGISQGRVISHTVRSSGSGLTTRRLSTDNSRSQRSVQIGERGTRSEPVTPAPAEGLAPMESSASEGNITGVGQFSEEQCPICRFSDWSNSSYVITECEHKYHEMCLRNLTRASGGYPECSLCRRFLFTPPPGTPTDELGRRIRPPTPPVHTVHSRSASPEGLAPIQGSPPGLMDTEESDDDADRISEIEQAELNQAIIRSLEETSVPTGGSYGQPNSRGEIPFTPNDEYRNEGQGQVMHQQGRDLDDSSAGAQDDQNGSPFHEGSTLLSRTLIERGVDGSLLWRIRIRNANNTVRSWQQYQPAGTEPLTEVRDEVDDGNAGATADGVDEQEVRGETEGQPQADAPAESRRHTESADETMTVEDRPRTPRGAVGDDVSNAPVIDDDGDVLMIRHMVGRRIVAEVDSELIGIAAIEDQRRQEAIEEAQLRQACINSMDDNLQAEADNYLAEVDAEAEAAREADRGDEAGDLPPGGQGFPGEGSDGGMDQS